MRTFMLVLLASALAIPAIALADRGSSGRDNQSTSSATTTRPFDDELELTARITSVSPLRVGSVTCVVPSGRSLAGFRRGDLVEITCDRLGNRWILRKLEREDDLDDDRGERRHSRSGHTSRAAIARSCDDVRGDGDHRRGHDDHDDDDDDRSGHDDDD